MDRGTVGTGGAGAAVMPQVPEREKRPGIAREAMRIIASRSALLNP